MRRALGVLLLGLVACTSQASTPPERPDSWTVELSTAPTLLLLTEDAVLAASYGNGVGGSQVYRVDRDSGRLAAQRTVAGQPNGMALGPDGQLWLATLQLPDQHSGTGLQVLDPVTLQTLRTVQVEGVPLSVAFVDGALWTGDDGGLRRLDPATGAQRERVPTQHPGYRLLRAGPGLVVVGPEGAQLVDPVSGRPGTSRALPAFGSVAATGDGDVLWLVHPDAQARSVLQRVDPGTLEPVVTADSPGSAGAVAWVAGDRLWVTDPQGGRLLCADALTGAVLAERPVAATGPLVADDSTVLVAQAGGLTALPATCSPDD